ncbi:hypothetical protein EG68_02894 [Paragonimus skrjabini miyazakii]|uniref:Doublecortin domain-containing protein n=1 Tax=Paragonimus skrjabini miyazakii TaxID=59628 RepID=A0A8S9YXV9_9TREM|nr:hypothetical protein EG68_02894 [Paragonimus skrjabini miyazakii]
MERFDNIKCDHNREGNTLNFVVHRNGDSNNSGNKVFINAKIASNLESLLEETRRQLGQFYPAINQLISIESGKPMKSIEDIDVGKRYIAVPRGDKLKHLDYERIEENLLHPKKSRTPEEIFRQHWRCRTRTLRFETGRLLSDFKKKPKTIYVYRNGDAFTPAIRVVLRPFHLMEFELVMRTIQDHVILLEGKSVRRSVFRSGFIAYRSLYSKR